MGYNPIDGSHAKTPAQIDMLVKGTQELIIKRGDLVNLMTDTTQFIGYETLFKKHSKQFDGGMDWEFDLILDHNHTSRFVKMYENDTANHVDATVKGKVGPRFCDSSYVYDVREKALQSNNAITVYNFIKAKMAQMYMSNAENIEAAIWGTLTYADDVVTPYGIPFWITKQSNANAALHPDGAFDGMDPVFDASSTSSTPTTVNRANVASATYARWRNWAAQYAAVSKEDLIKKMRIAYRSVDFRSPISQVKDPTLSTGQGIYVGLNTICTMEEILESQNMNLGNDLASKDGKCVFKGYEVTYAPKLNADTTDPVYMLNWKSLAVGALSNWKEHLSEPIKVPNQHNSRQVFLDGGWNMICTNLRTQAVIHKALAG